MRLPLIGAWKHCSLYTTGIHVLSHGMWMTGSEEWPKRIQMSAEQMDQHKLNITEKYVAKFIWLLLYILCHQKCLSTAVEANFALICSKVSWGMRTYLLSAFQNFPTCCKFPTEWERKNCWTILTCAKKPLYQQCTCWASLREIKSTQVCFQTYIWVTMVVTQTKLPLSKTNDWFKTNHEHFSTPKIKHTFIWLFRQF